MEMGKAARVPGGKAEADAREEGALTWRVL